MVNDGQPAALDYEDHIKDLGVTFDEKMDFSVHIAEKINKAYRMLWLIKRNFNEVGDEAFILLYKHLVMVFRQKLKTHLFWQTAILPG